MKVWIPQFKTKEYGFEKWTNDYSVTTICSPFIYFTDKIAAQTYIEYERKRLSERKWRVVRAELKVNKK